MEGVGPSLFNFLQWRCGSELPGSSAPAPGRILESLLGTRTPEGNAKWHL